MMKPFSFRSLILMIFMGLFFASCNNYKYLENDQTLYTGASLKIEANEKPGKALKNELEALLKPEPNIKVLWMRPKLWVYNIAGKTKKKKGFKYWLKNKIGNPPVLLDQVDPGKISDLLRNRLQNNGYFYANVDYEVQKKKKKASINYKVHLEKPYRINKIELPSTEDEIGKIITRNKEESLLKEGAAYSLEILKEERNRIDDVLKARGYYYFSPDFLIFKVDSTVGEKRINIYLNLKENIPQKALQQFRIGKVFIYPDYEMGKDTFTNSADTLMVDSLFYISHNDFFRPSIIARSVFIEPGDVYNRKAYDLTLSQLVALGVFKFVNIRFKEVNDKPVLDCSIFLSPLKKKSIRLEPELVTKSNDFAGPGLNVTFTNRNFLKGAENLSLELNSGFETQIKGQQTGWSYDVGANLTLSFPRYTIPFIYVKNSRGKYLPHTDLSVGASILNRVRYFMLSSFELSYGFRWKENASKEHVLTPVNINFVKLINTTSTFDSILNSNERFRQSFQEQFIIGAKYSYTYNSQVSDNEKNHIYFNGNIDISGNSLYGWNTLVKPGEKPYSILGQPFSQYSKFDIDTRYFYKTSEKTKIATRLIAGIGIPYLNSKAVPYIKQFFIGGPNSIRAYPARSLGPGSYRPPDSLEAQFFIDQTGDIKLEFNLEYRFPIVGPFKGAIFSDIGNVWLLHKNPAKPGGEFYFKKTYVPETGLMENFIDQIAIGTGAGLRFDISFFVIRLDLAWPVRQPFYPLDQMGNLENDKWVIDKINFFDPTWRTDNLVWNIAIGYPF